MIQGAPVILLDNLQRQLASSTLESMLTEPVADIRTFGKLSNLRVLCRSLVLLTANNASLRRDMLRRTLRLRIVVPDEKPELRRFDFDPVEEATRDRRELLAAAFTVLLAWLRVRDLPENKAHRKPLGSLRGVGRPRGRRGVLADRHQPGRPDRGEQGPGPAARPTSGAVIEALAAWQDGLAGRERQAARRWTAKEAAAGLDAELWGAVLEVKGDKPTSKQVGKWLPAGRTPSSATGC